MQTYLPVASEVFNRDLTKSGKIIKLDYLLGGCIRWEMGLKLTTDISFMMSILA